MTTLAELPNESRCWIFALEGIDDRDSMMRSIQAFLAEWKAHGAPVRGGAELFFGRFLVVAADPSAAEVSGCSIDSLFRTVSGMVRDLGVALLDDGAVHYREGSNETFRSVTRAEFKGLVESGRIKADTTVLDNTVTTLGEFRDKWQTSFANSWHSRAFRYPSAQHTN